MDDDIIKYFVKHNSKEKIIVPIVALSDNYDFFISKEEKYIVFNDKVEGKVLNWETKHICELEEEIKELYKCDVWSYLKKWYKYCKDMDSMHLLCMEIELDKDDLDDL